MVNRTYSFFNSTVRRGHRSFAAGDLQFSRGFTLVEMLVVMGIIAILFSFTSVNILSIRDSASISTTTATIISEIRQQQVKAMIGDTSGNGVRSTYGIYFQPGSYTVFPGAVYTPGNPDNFTVTVNESVEFENTFLNDTLVFASGSGEFVNYTDENNELIIRLKQTGEQRVVVFNRYGTAISAE